MENSRLENIIGNLRLKELEIIEKITNNIPPGTKMLRSLISPNQKNFIAVNGDWQDVLGYTEEECRGKEWSMIMPEYEMERSNDLMEQVKKSKGLFSEYTTDVLTKAGQVLKTSWKTKYYSDLNMIISIGKVI